MNDRVPASVRALINQFFATMDINDPAAGEILANGICSQDCIIAGVSQNFEGVERKYIRVHVTIALKQNRNKRLQAECLDWCQSTQACVNGLLYK